MEGLSAREKGAMDSKHARTPNSSVALDACVSRADSIPASSKAGYDKTVGRTEPEPEIRVLPSTTLEVEVVSGPPASGPEQRYRRVAFAVVALVAAVGLLCVVYILVIANNDDSDSAPQFAIGSHNFYHIAPSRSVLETLIAFGQAAVANEINTHPSQHGSAAAGIGEFRIGHLRRPAGRSIPHAVGDFRWIGAATQCGGSRQDEITWMEGIPRAGFRHSIQLHNAERLPASHPRL